LEKEKAIAHHCTCFRTEQTALSIIILLLLQYYQYLSSTMTTSSKHTRALSSLILSLVILMFTGFPSTAHAFRPLTYQQQSSTSAMLSTRRIESSSTARWVANSPGHHDEDDFLSSDELSDSSSLLESTTSKKTPEEISKEEALLWTQVKAVNNKFWDYTCNFFYVGMSCLILLNLSGYGYTISLEDGLNVMPMHTYRQDRQWREEIQKQQTPSVVVSPAALSSSTFQKEAAAFLLQQQQK
jgi:hypothetical protein